MWKLVFNEHSIEKVMKFKYYKSTWGNWKKIKRRSRSHQRQLILWGAEGCCVKLNKNRNEGIKEYNEIEKEMCKVQDVVS